MSACQLTNKCKLSNLIKDIRIGYISTDQYISED